MLDLDFETVYNLSILNPDLFWNEAAKRVTWSKPYVSVIEGKDYPSPRWFVDGEINLCYNSLDKQIEEGHGDEIAVIYESPKSKIIRYFTYKELLESVELVAGIMVEKCGVETGDNVFIYMPVIPECLITMLACARIGAVYSATFGGFATKEVSIRLNHFQPKIIFTSNIGVTRKEIINYKERLDLAIEISGLSVRFCVVYDIPNYEPAVLVKGRDLNWNSEILTVQPQKPRPVKSDHPLFVIYTSGTTGDPKGLVMETGGLCVVSKFSIEVYTGLKPRETFLCMSSFTWILGQSTLCYGPLMCRNPTIIYDDQPTDRTHLIEILRILKYHKVVAMMCPPTIMRLFKKFCVTEDFENKPEFLKSINLLGEITNEKTMNWVSERFHCPVFNSWGQTELGNFGTSPSLGLKRSTGIHGERLKSTLCPGYVGKIVDRDSGVELPYGEKGRFVLKLPLSPTAAKTLYRNHERFIELYFSRYPGYYDTMDSAVMDADNNVEILSRDDNIIHVASVRIDGWAVEEACLKNYDLEQVSVVALEDPIKGFVPFGFLMPRNYDASNAEDIVKETVQYVNNIIGEVAAFEKAVVVPKIPKSINGKTLRNSLEAMVNGKPFKIPAVNDDHDVYNVIYDILTRSNYKPSYPIS